MSDLRMILGPDGSRLQFTNGAPLLDDGYETQALISLFTSPGWCGNKLLTVPIGSDFEETCRAPITRDQLNRVRDAGERALRRQEFGRVSGVARNPESQRLDVVLTVSPPNQQAFDLRLTRDGGHWHYQATDPAYVKVVEPDRSVQESEYAVMFGDDVPVFGDYDVEFG